MKQNQFKFKPLDQVLVRDAEQGIWKVTLFSHYDDKCEKYKHVTVGGQYAYCIPYNEETAHLIGTDKPYREPEKKEWYVHGDLGGFEDIFTAEELIKFVTKNINNKDLHRFTIVYVNENT